MSPVYLSPPPVTRSESNRKPWGCARPGELPLDNYFDCVEHGGSLLWLIGISAEEGVFLVLSLLLFLLIRIKSF